LLTGTAILRRSKQKKGAKGTKKTIGVLEKKNFGLGKKKNLGNVLKK